MTQNLVEAVNMKWNQPPHMSDEQFGPLYHGAGAFVQGDIQPTTHPAGRSTAAWGTYDIDTAAKYAGAQALAQGTLFMPVYEVEHPEEKTIRYGNSVGSRNPLRIKRIAGYGSYSGKLI